MYMYLTATSKRLLRPLLYNKFEFEYDADLSRFLLVRIIIITSQSLYKGFACTVRALIND